MSIIDFLHQSQGIYVFLFLHLFSLRNQNSDMIKIFLLKGKEREDQEVIKRGFCKKGRGFSWNKPLFTIWKLCAESLSKR
jgi:hypothetical protein